MKKSPKDLLTEVATVEELNEAILEFQRTSNRLADSVHDFLSKPIAEGVISILENETSFQRAARQRLADLRRFRHEGESVREYIIRHMTEVAHMVPDEKANINCGPLKAFDKLVAEGKPEIEAALEAWYFQ